MNSSVPSASSAACAVPVRTCTVGGRICSISDTSWDGETPGLPATRIWSSLPTLWKSRCAVGRSKPASVAPPIESTEPNLTIPETWSVSTGPSTWTPSVEPTSTSFLLAVALSTTTSSALGQAPSTSVRLENSGRDGSTEKPRFGAPPKTIASPSLTKLRVLGRDAADRVGDVRQLPHLCEERLVERRLRRARALLDVERRTPGDRRVGALVDVREDRVERLVDRVGEDERAAHGRDAEDDRDRRQRGAELPGQQALEGEPDHSYCSARSGSSFAARRAGVIAARSPAIDSDDREHDQLAERQREAQVELARARASPAPRGRSRAGGRAPRRSAP